MATNNLKYRSFDSLLDDVMIDFQNISLESLLEPQQLIKVARRVTYDLGLRIYQTKEGVLEVERGRVRLPDDFYILNFGLVCGSYSVATPIPSGTHLEDRMINPVQYQCVPAEVDLCSTNPPSEPELPCNPCQDGDSCGPCNIRPCVRLNCKGEQYEVVHVLKYETKHYNRVFPLKIKPNPRFVDCDCPGLNWQTDNVAWIKDGFLFTSFPEGKVYINYQGSLEDDEGNLLVPDHELLNEYYEYSLKQRILENMMMNDENVTAKLQLVEMRLRAARNNAVSFVNMPDFAEIKNIFEMNRRAMYSKYYDMFKSYQNLGFNSRS